MTRPIRGTGGRFAGSIGRGKDTAPTSATVRPTRTPPSVSDEFTAGERAAEQRILTLLANLRAAHERTQPADPALLSPTEKGALLGAARILDETERAILTARAAVPSPTRHRDPVIAALADQACVPYEALIADRHLRTMLTAGAPADQVADRIARVHQRGETP